MNMARRSGKRAGFFCAVVAILMLALPCLEGKAGDQWRLIPVEVEGEKDTIVADFALGADGTPWVALARPQGTLCYRQAGQWHKIPGVFSFDPHQTQLHVAPAGRVYLSQVAPEGYARRRTPPKPHFGALYLLQDKHAEYVTEYYYDIPHMPAQLFFDSKGRIWNWGNLFLAKFEDGQWERVEANLGPDVQVIEDAQGNVYFFGNTLAYCRDGQLTLNAKPPNFPWEQQQRLKCYLWGRDKAFFLAPSHPGAVVIDLNTFAALDVLDSEPLSQNAMRELYAREYRSKERARENVPVLARSRLWDAFRDRDGNIWVLGARRGANYGYFKVRAADNTVEEQTETAAIDWGWGMGSERKPVLCATDRAIYIGGQRNGVYLYRDGVLTCVNWKQGLLMNDTRWLAEHPDGTIWFVSRRTGVAVYDPRGVPGTGLTPSLHANWEEYPLAAGGLVKDGKGGLWCCRKDQPGKASRWDGRTWEHFDLGLGTARLQCLWVDNLQRLLVVAYAESRPVLLRAADGHTEHFTDFKEMVLDSVRTGSREFKGVAARGWLGPLVTERQEIWCMDGLARRLMHHDGRAWQEVRADPSRASLVRHKDDQVLIATERGFETLDRGQLVEFTNEHARNREYLLGEAGLQPFDEQVYQERRGSLFPVREIEKTVYVFANPEDFGTLTREDVPPGVVELGQYVDRIWLADGGFWAHNDNLPEAHRYYEGLLLAVDLYFTPVAGTLPGGGADILEDSVGDLWIRRSGALFHVKRGRLDTRITSPQSTECTSPAMRVCFTGTSTRAGETLRYAWRLDGGPWSKPQEQQSADLEFARPGGHEFEVTSVGPMGNLDVTPTVLKLNVAWSLPEVRIVSAPREVVTNLDIAVGLEVVKRSEGSKLTFQWRLDAGPWHDTQETTVRPVGLADGEHLFEVRAVEDARYVQEPPASTEFTVKVDYEKVIRAAIQKLRSRDYGEREAAVARLVALGERCRPYLQKELESADEDTQWWIRAALEQIGK
jgi:hypothetical protein